MKKIDAYLIQALADGAKFEHIERPEEKLRAKNLDFTIDTVEVITSDVFVSKVKLTNLLDAFEKGDYILSY